MRRFVDERNPAEVITEDQLRAEYVETTNLDEMTFGQYLSNCMPRNNGTLTEIKEDEPMYYVFNGYYEVGSGVTEKEAKALCESYCASNNICFELKRELRSSSDVIVLIYQYGTLYLDTFVITSSRELKQVKEER